MYNIISEYQKAFNASIEKMTENNDVLGIMVFGSMITGDLWKESDIDLFVITKGNEKRVENIYSEENGIEIHIRKISKKRFMEVYENWTEGGYIHRLLCSSRLVFCTDDDIRNSYDSCRLMPNISREIWNMIFTARLLKDGKECRKYIEKEKISTAFTLIVKCIEEYSKLCISMNGYNISKDVVTMATDLNDKFDSTVKELYEPKNNMLESIENIIKYIDAEVNKNIKDISLVLVNYLKEADVPLSSREIEKSDLFKEYEIYMEEILNKLCKMNIIKVKYRPYYINKKKTFDEKVYYI